MSIYLLLLFLYKLYDILWLVSFVYCPSELYISEIGIVVCRLTINLLFHITNILLIDLSWIYPMGTWYPLGTRRAWTQVRNLRIKINVTCMLIPTRLLGLPLCLHRLVSIINWRTLPSKVYVGTEVHIIFLKHNYTNPSVKEC